MPVYQYRCSECKELHEATQRMSDPPLTECPACGGTLKRIIAPVALIFKGSGWHVTDYKPSDPKPSAAKSSTTDKASSEKGSSDAAPAKSEEKTASPESTPSTSPDSGTSSSQKVA